MIPFGLSLLVRLSVSTITPPSEAVQKLSTTAIRREELIKNGPATTPNLSSVEKLWDCHPRQRSTSAETKFNKAYMRVSSFEAD
ncbi:hypothetical protein Trydic_g8855 [Trypoxylus dichotomus]